MGLSSTTSPNSPTLAHRHPSTDGRTTPTTTSFLHTHEPPRHRAGHKPTRAPVPTPPAAAEPADPPAGPQRPSMNQVQRNAYRLAKQVCPAIGVKGLAKTYGGDPSDIGDVAHHYAITVVKPEAQIEAEQGCLDGLLR
jgi:hypothetical protein